MPMSSTLVIPWTPGSAMLLVPKGALAFTTLLALVALGFTFKSNFPGSMSTGTPIARIVSIGYFYLVSVPILIMFIFQNDVGRAKRHPNICLEHSGFGEHQTIGIHAKALSRSGATSSKFTIP